MNPPVPNSTADLLFVVGAVGVIAVLGVVAALRRTPGPRRTALFAGLLLAVLATGLSWWGWATPSDEAAVLEFSRVRPEGLDPYLRDAWVHFVVELIGIGAFAALVRAALHGRPRQPEPSPE